MSGTKFAVSASGTVTTLGLGVRFTVTFGGTSPGPHTVTFTQVSIPNSTLTISINPSRTILAPPGNQTVQFTVLSLNLAGLSGETAMLSYTIPDHGSGTVPAPIGGQNAQNRSAEDEAPSDEKKQPQSEMPDPEPEPDPEPSSKSTTPSTEPTP
jgi:hypothetical protein